MTNGVSFIGKTWGGEMRRLLRAIDDPIAMSRNTLVSELFESSHDRTTFTRIRAALLDAVEMLFPKECAHADLAVHRVRQYEIIKRYDLGDASMDEMLHLLCVERSQFYRERVCALEWLAAWVRQYVQEACEEQSASLQRLAGAREDPLEKARCLLRMAEIHLVSNRDEARAQAQEAVRLLDSAAS